MDKAKGSTANVVPSIVDAMPAGGMAAVLADPTSRTASTSMPSPRFAADGDFDGIDIDYEQFAFADGRETWAATRPNWVAFITELGARLHADGRTLTVSIPPIYDAGQTPTAATGCTTTARIAPHVDHDPHHGVRLLGRRAGPDRAVGVGRVGDHRRRSKPPASPDEVGARAPGVRPQLADGRVSGECPAELVEGRTSVTTATVDDLIARRNATPVFDRGDRASGCSSTTSR